MFLCCLLYPCVKSFRATSTKSRHKGHRAYRGRRENPPRGERLPQKAERRWLRCHTPQRLYSGFRHRGKRWRRFCARAEYNRSAKNISAARNIRFPSLMNNAGSAVGYVLSSPAGLNGRQGAMLRSVGQTPKTPSPAREKARALFPPDFARVPSRRP